jgi:ATP-dependent Clp protease ATP-binding subunit ClpC
MNDATLKELKIVVERAVRPVRARLTRKRKMREELLGHLVSIFEEELQRSGDEQAALLEAKRRFGTPSELTSELQESVSRWERVGFLLEKYFDFRAGEPVLHLAGKSILLMCMMDAAMLLAGVLISLLGARPNELPMFLHVTLVTGVVMAAFMFVFLLSPERIGRALYGEKSEQSLRKVMLYCLASLPVLPVFAFVTYLAMTFDLAPSLAHFRFACCFAPATPLIFFLMARPMSEEIRYKQQWASLEIGE